LVHSGVIPGLVPGIHVLIDAGEVVDGRDKPGHDEKRRKVEMPEITVSMAAGRTDEQKAGMMRDITRRW
jgi:hypothetical protein